MATTDREFIERSLRWGLTALAIFAVVAFLLFALKSVLTPVAAAFALAYFLDPVIDWFEARRISRRLAILGLLLAFGAALGVALAFGIPAMQREVAQLAQDLPGYLERNADALLPAIESRFGVRVPGTFAELVERVQTGEFEGPIRTIESALAGLLEGLTGTVGALVALLIVPILAYYFLVDFDRLKLRPLELVPPRHHDYLLARRARSTGSCRASCGARSRSAAASRCSTGSASWRSASSSRW